MNIAIITARGGSKRIPNKNIRKFAGNPIIVYSINAAIESKLFDEVMVSTDSKVIAEIAKEYGASVPFMRSSTTSDDYSTTADVLFEVLDNYEMQGKSFGKFCCIYPTAPFVTSQKLSIAMELLKKYNADAVFPVVPFSYPPLRGLVINNNILQMKWPENSKMRSQDLEPIYHDSGQFYLVQTKAFLTERTLFCKKTIPMIVSEMETQDIDNEADWKLAELKYELMTSQCFFNKEILCNSV